MSKKSQINEYSDLGLVLNLVDSLGKEITGSYNCPLGATEVVLTKVVDGNSNDGGRAHHGR
jgi:hypothetical protein